MDVRRRVDWFENDTRIYPAHFHASNLMDILLYRDISSHYFLKKTCLYYDDISAGGVFLSADQFCQIIENSQNLYGSSELSFRWGHGLFPGHFDGFSQLLSHSQTLDELLLNFCIYPQLTPMMTLKRWEDEKTVYFQWSDSIGVGKQHSFLVEAYTTGIISLVNWLFEEKLPWRFCFSGGKPKYIEEYEVNLGPDIQFDLGVDMIMINRDLLDRKIPQINKKSGSLAAKKIAKQQCDKESSYLSSGFVQSVLYFQSSRFPNSFNLSEMADLFEMSPATFKRKLSKHNFSFQRVQDLARLNTSIQLIQKKGLKNLELADYWEIKDVNNFRRAFKRWCGMTPSEFRARMA